jgi:hypothetical protein
MAAEMRESIDRKQPAFRGRKTRKTSQKRNISDASRPALLFAANSEIRMRPTVV